MPHGFTEINGVLHADDVPLTDLAQRYGTPLYVYSASAIRANVTRLKDALEPGDGGKPPLIAFACKANSNLAVLALLGRMGLGCDVVSGGELERAIRAGIAPGKIVYSGVGKSDAEIARALELGILQINVESSAELESIVQIAAALKTRARVALRYNPDVAAKTHHKITTGRRRDKFGMSGDEIRTLYPLICKQPELEPRGLHMHIGSQLTDMTAYAQAFEKLAQLAAGFQKDGLPVPALDIGGGLGVIYRDERPADLQEYANLVETLIRPLGTDIVVEPGRFIVADAGALLCRVSYIKSTEAGRHAVLDAGMNDLLRPALYDAWHPIRKVTGADKTPATYDIVGPVCETGDTFMRDCTLPELAKGDLVTMGMAGAYGFVMASNYNTRPLPAELLVDGVRSTLIRQRQTVQDIMEAEAIPDWLGQDARSA